METPDLSATDVAIIRKAWSNMIERCTRECYPNYHNYGGRGIAVCPEWRTSFAAFLRDMAPTWRPGLTLDRVDVNGNYEPRNVRWATRAEQARNRRNNVRLRTFGGGITVLRDAARAVGVHSCTLKRRIVEGRGPTWNGVPLFELLPAAA